MTDTARNILLGVMVVFLVVVAFAAGYFTNDYVELSTGTAKAADDKEKFSLFWEAWGWIEQSYIGEVPPMKRVTYGAIRGALSELNDPYTVFIEPPARDEERDSLRGNFGGIGANIMRNEAGEVVLDPIPDNPAEAAGILPGDVLLAVDGLAIDAEMTVEAIAQLIRGEKETTVTLTVRHPSASDAVDISIVRDDILIPSVSYRILASDRTIGYIQLSRFSGESSNEVRDAVRNLRDQGARSLILDLRQNGGGLLDAAVDVADHFIQGGPVIYQQSKGEEERLYEASAETIAGDMPLVVLVDGGTASSSEILAGALQDRDRAVLVGSRTFGKGSVQLVYDLSDGSSVHVTSSRWFTPDHHQIDQQGLEPNIPVEITQEAIDDGRDVVLDRAVEYIQNGMTD